MRALATVNCHWTVALAALRAVSQAAGAVGARALHVEGLASVPLGSLLALVDLLVRRFRYVDKTIALVLAFIRFAEEARSAV